MARITALGVGAVMRDAPLALVRGGNVVACWLLVRLVARFRWMRRCRRVVTLEEFGLHSRCVRPHGIAEHEAEKLVAIHQHRVTVERVVTSTNCCRQLYLGVLVTLAQTDLIGRRAVVDSGGQGAYSTHLEASRESVHVTLVPAAQVGNGDVVLRVRQGDRRRLQPLWQRFLVK